MYAPNYGNPNPNANPSAFNGAQLPQNPQQQQQHMMFNPQQYGSPYGQPNGMPMGANGAGMMQNGGMAQMGGPPQNNVTAGMPQYQTPYTSSPYGASIPTSAPGQSLQQFMPGGAPNFNMNPQAMPNMHPQQRAMQPPQGGTPQRPYSLPPQNNTPTHTHPQFAPPQIHQQHHTPQPAPPHLANQHAPQQTNPTQGQQKTPQTPNFPPPLSPASESREKERVTLLLEINRDLLMELMRISQEQAEKKKEGNAEDKTGEKSVQQKLYLECMRRLQANLAYLAAIADRSHKPLNQIPPHPAWMSAPPMPDQAQTTDSPTDSMSTISSLQESYKKLHALFPGVDPKREPPMASQGQKAGPHGASGPQTQGPQTQAQPGGMSNAGTMNPGGMGGMSNMSGMGGMTGMPQQRPKSSQMQGSPGGQVRQSPQMQQQQQGMGIGGPMAMSMSMPPSQAPQGPR